MSTMERVKIEIGNWWTLGCDTIISPTYPSFLKRYGLSREVYRAAGEKLESECVEFLGGAIGSVRITRAYNLIQYGTAWIVHAVPPRGNREEQEEDKLMRSLYRNSLQACVEYDNIYRKQISRCASRYYQGEKLQDYLNKVERYIKKHSIQHIGIIPLKTYSNNKERSVKICLEMLDEFLRQDKKIEAVHIICEDLAIYNEYAKWLDLY